MKLVEEKRRKDGEALVIKVKQKMIEIATTRRDVGGSPLTSIEKGVRERLIKQWQMEALNTIIDPEASSTHIESKLSKTQISPTIDIFQQSQRPTLFSNLESDVREYEITLRVSGSAPKLDPTSALSL